MNRNLKQISIVSANKREGTQIKTKAVTGCSALLAHKQNIHVHPRSFVDTMLCLSDFKAFFIKMSQTSAFMLAIVLISLSLSPLASADVVNNTHWAVKSGDSVYGIARQLYPNSAKMRAKFRRELVKNNPGIFQGNASLMSVGVKLVMPSFALKNNTPAPVKITPVEKTKVIPAKTIPLEKNNDEKKPAQKMLAKKPATEITTAVIGKVVINIGGMEAENNGKNRILKRNSKIHVGDTLKTLNKSHTQLRFKDGALISLRPNTIFKIREYNYNGTEDGSEKSLFELIKGGFRTITGAIGHRNKQNYQVKTSVATIGIRGTHYGLMVCNAGNCLAENKGGLEDGLYGGVVDGSIVINNQSGEHHFNNDQFFKLTSLQAMPVEMLKPPPVLSDSTPIHQQAGDHPAQSEKLARQINRRKGSGPRSIAHLQKIIKKPPAFRLPDNLQLQAAQAIIKDAPPGAVMGLALFDSTAVTGSNFATAAITAGPIAGIKLASLNDIGNIPVSGFENTVDAQGVNIRRQFAIGDPQTGTYASPVPSSVGGSTLGVNWGRWEGQANLSQTNLVAGTTQPINQSGDVHFIYSNKTLNLSELGNLAGTLGQLTYSTATGNGTLPTDKIGNVGTSLANITVNVDFATQSVNSYLLDVSVVNAASTQSYSMSSLTVIPFSQLGQSFGLIDQATTTCTSGACTGSASLRFVGDAAGAAITTYSVGESDGSKGITGTNLLFNGSVIAPPLQN